jgi:hypothetical protein
MSKHTPRKAFAPVADVRDPETRAPLGDPAPAAPPDSAAACAIAPDRAASPPAVRAAAPPPAAYDPADYRWVPVRRRPRLDGWTEEKQRRFIETLADTGLVNVAARAVGMSRESAYRLRRAAHGAAFARAWDAARHHAGGLIEDIAFERAIEGTEQEVLDGYGNVIATRLVHDNRLLKYLLSHLKPERYGGHRSHGAGAGTGAGPPTGAPAAPEAAAMPALAESLRAMEPALPAAPEQMLGPETLADELVLADAADGVLPHFLREQRPPKTDAALAAEAAAARAARGAAALAKREAGGTLTEAEFADECYHLDPVGSARPRCRRRRDGPMV